ncbi:MAG: hypothetical protein ACKVXR_12625 [Planctomycetota bacterium]
MSTLQPILFAATLLLGRAPALAPARVALDAPPPVVAWKELSDRPIQWLGQTVRLQLQFSNRVAAWNPYMTRFGPGQFTAFQAWTDDQFPWIKAEYDAPAVRVFSRIGSASDWALEAAKPGARFEMTVIVRETFLDLPWVEIIGILPLPERISEGASIHAGKACELMQARSFTLAQSELEQSITDDLPPPARAELERLLALCRDAIALEKGERGASPARR